MNIAGSKQVQTCISKNNLTMVMIFLYCAKLGKKDWDKHASNFHN
jgi:hypothetical protein